MIQKKASIRDMDREAHRNLPVMLRALKKERLNRPPIWFMRQAGRYLPEYRNLRAQASDFISFCLNSKMAAEATLQPMRRFDLDAAIVFSDILLLPKALGQSVWFETNEGPKLGPLPEIDALRAKIKNSNNYLKPVGETIARVRDKLEPERALIGFAGAPWTVATYMIEGRSSDRNNARIFAYQNPKKLDELIDVLIEATVNFLLLQVESGAQILQLFESWSENLSEDLFEHLIIRPHNLIVEKLKMMNVEVPIIGFPRGAGTLIENYGLRSEVDAVSLDTTVSIRVGKSLQEKFPIQGALDPILLSIGGYELDKRVEELLQYWGDGPYIFNLGHGILPNTPIKNIEKTISRVKNWKI